MRLKHFVITTYMQQQKSDTKAEFMRILPLTLLAALQYETWSPVLQKNCFFDMMYMRHNRTIRTICHQALVEVAVYKEEVAFSAADSCDKAFILTSGNMTYEQAEYLGSSSLTHSPHARVARAVRGWQRSERTEPADEEHSCSRSQAFALGGTTFCEAALWCRWTCHGQLQAESFALLAGIVA